MHASTSNRWRWALTLALLTLLYLLLRTTDLDRVVTTDEPFWLGRSANFYRALWQGDFADTFQHAHPGVTTMWAGMLGYWVAAPDYINVYDTNLNSVYHIHQRLRAMGVLEMDVLIAARLAKLGLQAVLFALSLVWLRRLFGTTTAVVAGSVVALDPFLIAHDRLLHVDGLLAISSLAAVLALADADTRPGRRTLAWLVAGALAALAWLTRSTGLALGGVAGLVLLTDAVTGDECPRSMRLRATARHGALWAGAAVATTFILWPVLWAAPQQAMSFMVDWISEAAAEGHELPVYFLGEIETGDPGPLFYPVTILWRLSVANTIVLLLAAVALAVPGIRRTLPERILRAGAILLLFAVIYTAGMTLGAKKFDRYVLPAHAMLDVIAAIGIVATLRWALPKRRSIAQVAMPVALITLLLVQTVVTLGYRPYYLAAYNPLLGGAEAAEDVVQIGWGEGIDAAARWVIEETGVDPGDEITAPPVLRISGGSAPLRYALPPPYVVESSGFRTAEDWATTDYYVGYIQQWQRGLSGDVIGYLHNFEPAYTLWVEGVRYVDVWELKRIPPPPWLTGTVRCEWRFEPWLQLENVVIDGETVALWFQTLTAIDLPGEVVVTVNLIPRALDTPTVEETWTTSVEPRRGRALFTDVTLEIPPLAAADAGDYLLAITVHDGATGEPLSVYPPGSSVSQPTAVIGSRCADDDPAANPANAPGP